MLPTNQEHADDGTHDGCDGGFRSGTRRRGMRWVLALGLLCLWLVWPSGVKADTVVTLGETDGVTMPVGDALFVQWPGAPLNTPFRLQLVDEASGIVIERQAVADIDGIADIEGVADIDGVADIEGVVGGVPFWNSGIVGCGADANVDVEMYQFARFEDAEAVLLERTFELRALKMNSDGVLATAKVTFGEIASFFFVSDASGCPRSVFDADETMFLSAFNMNSESNSVQVFIVADLQVVPPVGMQIEEVREMFQEEPQKLLVPPSDRLAVFEPMTGPLSLAHEFDELCFEVLIRQEEGSGFEVEPPDTLVKTRPYEDGDDLLIEGDCSGNGVRVHPYRKPIDDGGEDED